MDCENTNHFLSGIEGTVFVSKQMPSVFQKRIESLNFGDETKKNVKDLIMEAEKEFLNLNYRLIIHKSLEV